MVVRPPRRVALLTGLFVLTSLLVASPASAATFAVTANRIDSGDGDATDPIPDGCQPADCSLREAVIAANGSPGPDAITFAESGTVTLTQFNQNSDSADVNDLDVRDALTITGPSGGVSIRRGFATGPFSRIIFSTSPLTIDNVTIFGGDVQGTVAASGQAAR